MSKVENYRVFVAIVENGSILQAALKLNYSAPAVSKQLAKLEQNVQAQLFHRSHKKLELTDAGKRFYPRCKSILASIYQAEDELLAEDEAVVGPISITLSKALARSNIFDVLSSFTQKYPQVQFDIHFSDNLEDLHDENLDFAFRMGKLPDSNHLIAMQLIDVQLVACATPNYLEQHGTPTDFSDLGSAKFILMSSLSNSQAMKAFFKQEKIRPDSAKSHICSDIEGVYQSVRAGLGIGMLPNISITQEIEEKKFIAVLPEKNLPRKRMYLVYKKSQWQTQKQLAFKAHIKSSLSDALD